MNGKDEEYCTEDLVVRSLGYLRTPEKFRRKFGVISGKNSDIKTPRAILKEENGKVILSYIWDESDFKNKEE